VATTKYVVRSMWYGIVAYTVYVLLRRDLL